MVFLRAGQRTRAEMRMEPVRESPLVGHFVVAHFLYIFLASLLPCVGYVSYGDSATGADKCVMLFSCDFFKVCFGDYLSVIRDLFVLN